MLLISMHNFKFFSLYLEIDDFLFLFSKFKHLTSLLCLVDRQCPYVIEAINALAELGVGVKDIILLFPQVCLRSTKDQII